MSPRARVLTIVAVAAGVAIAGDCPRCDRARRRRRGVHRLALDRRDVVAAPVQRADQQVTRSHRVRCFGDRPGAGHHRCEDGDPVTEKPEVLRQARSRGARPTSSWGASRERRTGSIVRPGARADRNDGSASISPVSRASDHADVTVVIPVSTTVRFLPEAAREPARAGRRPTADSGSRRRVNGRLNQGGAGGAARRRGSAQPAQRRAVGRSQRRLSGRDPPRCCSLSTPMTCWRRAH